MRKTTQFRRLLEEPGPVLLGGVYDGLSARLAEQAGFDALWSSGFCISTSKGVPDAGLLTMTELLGATREINRTSSLPVIADVDDGFGDAVNVDRMVREYEAAGVAGICIEDNRHPKRNSLTSDLRCALASAEEFSAKIRVAKAASQDPDFVVIARIEALIAGLGQSEAMRRATMYALAGADLIVIHSKSDSVADVREFALHWTPDVPLVAIPTTYSDVTVPELHGYGFKVCIFANQGMRAAIVAMRRTYETMVQHQSIVAAGDQICPLTDMFKVAGFDHVRHIESEFIAPALAESIARRKTEADAVETSDQGSTAVEMH